MLIVKVKQDENIDRAIKRYRRKHRNVKMMGQIRERSQYVKPSIKKRETLAKAKYKQHLLQETENL